MRNFNVVFLAFVFCVLVAGKTFSQENNGYTKPTFGAGVGIFSADENTEILTIIAIDVDFVNSFGLTFGLQSAMAWNNYIAPVPLITGGIGYTYTTNKWSAGGKLMFTPSEGGGMGGNINGTYWFIRNLGITGTIDNYFFGFSPIGYNLFSVRIGISTKL
jgi:hypothetical protein